MQPIPPDSATESGPAPVAEAEAFLAARPEVRQVQLLLTDICGVARGKQVRREELLSAYRDGRPLPRSILGMDITGTDVPALAAITRDGDPDRLCWPIPGSLKPAPWLETPSGIALIEMRAPDGRAEPGDPRAALARVVESFRPLGLRPVLAFEFEFYLVDTTLGPEGALRPARGLRAGRRPGQPQAYALSELTDFAPFFEALYGGAEAMGLPARTLISEYAPGQFEIVLGHRADALQAADEAILYKRLVKGTAERFGLTATFMAKPYGGLSGSGLHLHLSLADETGANLFAGAAASAQTKLGRVLQGLVALMPDSLALFAPNANSYRRFRAGSYAPLRASWGEDDRNAALRLTGGMAETRHIEHRVAGADANPYLAAAAVLAAARLGLEQPADAALLARSQRPETAVALPTNWDWALARLARSEALRAALGADFLETFLTIKRAEAERFQAEVTPLDHAWCLAEA